MLDSVTTVPDRLPADKERDPVQRAIRADRLALARAYRAIARQLDVPEVVERAEAWQCQFAPLGAHRLNAQAEILATALWKASGDVRWRERAKRHLQAQARVSTNLEKLPHRCKQDVTEEGVWL